MESQNHRRPHTSVGIRRQMNHLSNYDKPLKYDFRKQTYITQNKGSYSRTFAQSCDYKKVKIFNLNPGCHLTKSPGKISVKIHPQHFIDYPKPQVPEKVLKPVEMESIINDLRVQVSTLSTFLEEERLRHGSTKKRASLDLKNQENSIVEKNRSEIEKICQGHENEKLEISQLHKKSMLEFEQEWKNKYEQLRTEYRMLQASFKIYRQTLQEEKNEEWRLLKEELNWEKRREIENAVDDSKKLMEENFTKERESMRREFKLNLNDMMHDHRQELQDLTDKLTNSDYNLEEIKRRSNMLDSVQQELEQLKLRLENENKKLNETKSELNKTKISLSSLQLEFEDRVSSIDDFHRSKISSLTLENSDVRMRLIHSAEELHKEKIEKEKAESEKREILTKVLEKKLISQESLNSTKKTNLKSNLHFSNNNSNISTSSKKLKSNTNSSVKVLFTDARENSLNSSHENVSHTKSKALTSQSLENMSATDINNSSKTTFNSSVQNTISSRSEDNFAKTKTHLSSTAPANSTNKSVDSSFKNSICPDKTEFVCKDSDPYTPKNTEGANVKKSMKSGINVPDRISVPERSTDTSTSNSSKSVTKKSPILPGFNNQTEQVINSEIISQLDDFSFKNNALVTEDLVSEKFVPTEEHVTRKVLSQPDFENSIREGVSSTQNSKLEKAQETFTQKNESGSEDENDNSICLTAKAIGRPDSPDVIY